ncbi:MAG TPA: hypothetical protein VGP17_14370 [Solirubrobacteraceae bacterium]|nr:hypothetical protein [Solirubrobacteraceae bacterium]
MSSREQQPTSEHAQPQASIAERIAAARQLPSPPKMPPVDLRTRLATSLPIRRLLPTPTMVRRAKARARVEWESTPKVRAEAIEVMSAILGNTDRESELMELSPRYVEELKVHEMLFWQPWPFPNLDETSRERLQRVVDDKRGAVLSGCHFGQWFLLSSAVRVVGGFSFALGGAWFYEPPSHDRWGRRQAHWQRWLHRRHVRTIPAGGSFPVAQQMLEEGELILNMFDMPGRHETRFLGKSVMLADGSARLAFAADALVLPLRSRRDGHHVWVDVEEPLDPRAFDDADALHDSLAEVHTRWILQAPWALESPRRPGAWEEAATPTAWTLPARL